MTQHDLPRPALLRGLTRRRFGRRAALSLAGLSALGPALAACGVKGKGRPAASASGAATEFWKGRTGTGTGTVRFASWPLYMDPAHPELTKFTAETGIKVDYQEVIPEMGPWFARIQPQLKAGQDIGFDLMIITNGVQFRQLADAGFLAPLDHSRLPNFAAQAGPAYREEAFDRGNVLTIPWASGMTGIAYDRKKTGRDITKLADLWDPAFKGRVGMLADPAELGNAGMLALGIDPVTSTPDDWRRAAKKLQEQKDAGLVRNYYDQSYIDALGKGEVWVTQAWSGDIYQKNLSEGTDYTFVIPEEGGTLWTDNLAIPVTARNPVDALTLMDFFYRVDNAASLAAYIAYVCPVPAARDQLAKDAAKAKGDDRAEWEAAARSPLVFPAAGDYSRLHYFRDFATVAEQQEYQRIFDPIVLG
ncbi:spermidine/putrescine ABC transporter substrate-binding protein [Actinoplanes sp. NPDC051859]|uniref:spermidine/putrescine ABC transporter substrate-binding protein n=1 Tax=Actinoplanes sp. NPDC051859 TaxID=3363909 RepID=UPI00378F0F8A